MNNSGIFRNEIIGAAVVASLIFITVLTYGIFGLISGEIHFGKSFINYKYVGLAAELISISIILLSICALVSVISLIYWIRGNHKNLCIFKISVSVFVLSVFMILGTVISDALGHI